MTELTYVDLFAGIGGFRMALEQLPNITSRCVLTSEIEPYAQQVYEANFLEKPQGDLTKIATEDIPEHDLLLAGFPCQSFSTAGKKEGLSGTKGTLFYEIVRLLEAKKPRMFLLENVQGLPAHEKGQTERTILTSLENLGYKVFTTILDSSDFGVSQKRKRWYCVGFLADVAFQFPIGNQPKVFLKDIINVTNTDPTLRLSPQDIARVEYHLTHYKHTSNGHVKHQFNAKPGTTRAKYGVKSHFTSNGNLRFYINSPLKTSLQSCYFLSQESIGNTLQCSHFPKLWDLKRRLSLDEMRQMQGFPNTFQFPVSYTKGAQLLGNSVTVPVIRAILEQMIKTDKERKENEINQVEN